MKLWSNHILPILAIFLVSALALVGTLAVAVMAHAGATRVAVFASSDAWARVQAAGLPVVRLALGGALIVVDGTGAPDGLARLRSGSLFLFDAGMIPGCSPPGSPDFPKVSP